MALSYSTEKREEKGNDASQQSFTHVYNRAAQTRMLNFKSLKEHKVACFVNIFTFWDLPEGLESPMVWGVPNCQIQQSK